MNASELKNKIETMGPNTVVAQLVDLTGTEDHWQATIVSDLFLGLSMIDQHKMVMKLLKTEIDSNEVHALTMKTFTHEQFKKTGVK